MGPSSVRFWDNDRLDRLNRSTCQPAYKKLTRPGKIDNPIGDPLRPLYRRFSPIPLVISED